MYNPTEIRIKITKFVNKGATESHTYIEIELMYIYTHHLSTFRINNGDFEYLYSILVLA